MTRPIFARHLFARHLFARHLFARHLWLVQVLLAGAMLMSSLSMPVSAFAQQPGKFTAEVVKIDLATSKITLKAVMGHRTLRVSKPDLLDGLKPGDQVLIDVGQDGMEVVVTTITLIKL